MNIELKEKIARLAECLNSTVHYEINYTCDSHDQFASYRESHRIFAEGFQTIYRPTSGQVMNLSVEDFVRGEK
jgi:hypothetical protein